MKSLILVLAVLALVAVNAQEENVQISYNEQVALSYLYVAKASYCSKQTIEAWNCGPCAFHPQMRSATVFKSLLVGAQGFAAYNAKTNQIVVAFRGSENIQNWVENVRFVKTDFNRCGNCKVHVGFLDIWNQVQGAVFTSVQQLKQQYPGAGLLVTGHSLGGAIATLAAIDLQRSVAPVTEFYTFASPRIGNDEFAAYARGLLPNGVRVVHYHDTVPHMPLHTMGFRHVPTEVWYTNRASTQYTVCDNSGEDHNCSWKLNIALSIADHLEYLGVYTGCDGNGSLEEESQLLRVRMNEHNKELEALQAKEDEIIDNVRPFLSRHTETEETA